MHRVKRKHIIFSMPAVLIITVLVWGALHQAFAPTIPIPVFHQDKQLIFAHRGGRSLGPENTLYTFQRALNAGMHVLEIDARLTRDGHLVAIHDATVDRTTDGSGTVGSMSLDEIGRLDAAFDYSTDGGQTFPLRNNGVTVPLLSEVFRRFPRTPMNIELKDNSIAAAETLCRYLSESKITRQIIVASFHSRVIRHFRSICPDTPTAAAPGEVRWFVFFSRLHLEALYRPHAAALQVPKEAYGFLLVTPRFIDAARHHDLKVHVWTVNRLHEKQALFNMGVDGIITDFP